MLSYNWFPVIGLCPLLPALHGACVCVFPYCASVFATVLSGIISLRMFDRRALLAIKSAAAGAQRSSRYISGCCFPSCRSCRFWFGGLIGGSAGREPVFLCCFVSLGERKWIVGSFTPGAPPVRFAWDLWGWIDFHAHLCLPPWAVMWKRGKPRLIMVGFALQLTPKSGLCSRPLYTLPRGPQH